MKLKKSGSSTGSRLRKKHKRLDAICERVYTQNHSESIADLEPRRSSRMRRPPDLLDASPPPAKKRKKNNSTYASSSLKGVKEEDEAHDDAESGDVGDLDSPESWKSRLRTRAVRQKGGQSSRRRKLFHQSGTAESKLDHGKLGLVKSRRLGRVKAVNGSVGGDKEGCLQLGEGMSGKGVAEVCVGKDESAEDELDLPRNEGSNGGMRISGEEISRGVRKKGEQNSRRRKLFHQLATAENELGSGKLRLVKSKTLRRIKAVNGSVGGDKEACLQLGEDMIGKDVDEVRIRKDESVEDELDLPRNEGADGGMRISVEEVSRGIQQKGGQTSQRMKLFHQLGTEEIEFGHGKLGLVKSKRLGRIKAANDSIGADNEACLQHGESMSGKDIAEECVGKDESAEDELDLPRNEGEEGGMRTSGEEIGGGNTGEGVDGNALQSELDQVEKKQRPDGMELDERLDGNGHVENVEQMDNKNMEEFEVGANGKDEADILKVDGALTNDMEEGRYYRKGDSGIEVNDMTFGGVRDGKVEAFNCKSANIHGRSQVKHGRRCGLCGCGNDGKPPKRLLQDTGDSENEAYSGSSASEEVKYDVWDGFGDEPGWLGCLLGPVNDRYGIAGIWVHQHCAVWSPEVYFAGLGCLKNVRAALCRGRALKCSRCGRPGATIGCRVDRCPKTYHLPCARASSCIFDHRKFLIACTYHRHLFQPHGIQYAMRIKKLKAKKMKLELRKVSNDAWRKDVEAEEKWMEKCGEDDEFLKREGKRLHRDLLRIAPVYIGGSESESGKAFDGWESVAGLQDVIRCMKEVVILPLLYPEFFSNLGITPPRGILLHGYPGTGKTLVVRALIGSCARGDKRIAYFARKGADCLGKYVGDAERQLRLLFQVAERCQPSVIFFDEIDGLAPVRTRQQDQTHSSVVSTLLALMDGLKSRGSVVVIGATNRPEAVDPALRRPGRFDREIYFPLPSVEDRAAILSLHTQRWPKPVSGSLLKWIATETAGFAGADLQALCTQAAIIALKRNFPLQKVLSAAGKGAPGYKRAPLPAFAVDERDWLEALACAPPPCSHREAGIAASDFVSSPLPTHLIPCLLQPLCTFLVSIYLHEDLWLPPSLLKAGTMIKNAIVSFLEKKNTPSDTWWSHVDNFLKEAEVEREVRRRLSCAGMLIGDSRCIDTDSFAEHEGSLHSDVSRTTYFAPRTKSGFRVLVAGSSRSGQRHLASCILHCFVGNVEIQKVDLATLSQEGHGDLVRGITQILMRCTGFRSCMIFMPRIDLWAMEGCHPTSGESNASPLKNELSPMKESCSPQSQVIESKNDSSAYQCEASESTKPQLSSESASLAWSTFVEQVESICVSTSLMILATSELPYNELPPRVRQFFKGDCSNSSLSKPLQHTIPRFVVNIDGKFNRPAVISLSAEELLRDMIQSFVQFIHQRNHVHISCEKEYTVSESVQGCLDAENPTKDQSPKVPPLPSTRNFKGKSTLLLAISTFGYQILRYPHFAELCWVTSKLQEGPCADVSGPWKGWPFNSCIIRPGNPLDKEAVGCSSGNIKSKEISGVVRGLMAVGLLAYRGMYSSAKDVSFEVRNVLELLVGQVNEKIQAGKDRYQYVRLLSQVAHLEDMINNWAYSLQSLEPEGNMEMANATETTKGIPNDTLRDDAVQCHCKENTSGRNIPESELQGGSPKGFTHENLEGSPEGENGFCHPDSERTAAFSEDGTAQNHSVCDCITCKNPDEHFKKSTAGDQLAGNITNEQNRTTIGLSELIDTEEPAVNDGNSGSLKHSDGFTVVDNSNISENSFQFQNPAKFSGFDFLGAGMFSYRSSELSAVGDKTGSNNAEPNCIDNVGDTNFISETSSISDSGVTCSYHCCDGCLHALHILIQKILVNEWGLNEMDLTVEDIHDAVASCSVSLLSAVRKVDTAETPRNSSDENPKCANAERYSDWPELSECCCGTSENGVVMPMECSCHAAIGCVTGEANDSLISQCGFHPNFVFRDGVLVPVDSNTTTLVSFHCKYNNLCLCSIIKSVVMVKQALD